MTIFVNFFSHGAISTVIHRVFGTNSGFHVKQRATGNINFYFSRVFC